MNRIQIENQKQPIKGTYRRIFGVKHFRLPLDHDPQVKQ